MADTHRGTCYCGSVEVEASATPLDMGYCHCEACRRYSGAPFSSFTLWKAENVRIAKGEEFLGRYKSSEISDRLYCTKCGGHVMVDHPALGLTDIRAPLPTLGFKPTVHLNYQETVLPIKDGLPKLKDFPAAIGGSGDTMPE
ncbi:MAG: GFA family protein [Chthoniobacterales bacterium]